MRSWKKLLILSMVLVFVFTAFAAGCSNKNAGTAKSKDTFILATSNQAPALDPANASSNAVNRLVALLYDGLVTYAPDSTKVVGALADTWEASPDAKTFTFHIRKDAKFSDGSAVTADAVKFSFDRAMKVGKMAASAWSGIIADGTITVVDPSTVKFTLKDPTPSFLAMMATPAGLIVNPKVKDQYKGDDNGEGYLVDHAVGSGRYTVKSFTPNGDAVFVRNDKWYGQKSAIKNVIVRIVPEAATQRMMLEKGEIDMIEGRFLDWDTIVQLGKEDGITVPEVPGMDILRFILNSSKKPFNDIRVRKALAESIDYEGILKDIYGGHADRLLGGIPKGLLGYDANALKYEQNIDDAKKLLKDAGYPNGLTLELSAGPIDLWRKVATKVQSDAAKAGIKIEIREYALPALYQKMSGGDFAMGMSGWTPDYADPDYNVWYFFYSKNAGAGYNWAFLQDPNVDSLILQARNTVDEATRANLYKQITQITNEMSVYIPIAQPHAANPMRSWVKGYVLNPMNVWALPMELMSKNPQ
ncbi:MAG: ABC transporter substrate-binding protein [Bacillota bacterium]